MKDFIVTVALILLGITIFYLIMGKGDSSLFMKTKDVFEASVKGLSGVSGLK